MDDKTFCVYLAKDEAVIRRHAEMSGFPATKITEVRKMFDPTTADSFRVMHQEGEGASNPHPLGLKSHCTARSERMQFEFRRLAAWRAAMAGCAQQ